MSTRHTLFRWISDRARMAPDVVAIEDRGAQTTYAELSARSHAVADALAAGGYGRGDRIVTISGNSADQIVLFFAAARLGIALVPLMWRLTAFELAGQITHADPHLVVIEDEYAELGAQALELLGSPDVEAVRGTSLDEPLPHATFAELTAPPTRLSAGPPMPGPAEDEDVILILFTSGSSGLPKAVQLTHSNCFWNNLSFSRTIPMTDTDVVLTVLPQFHSGGWNVQTLLAFWVGARIVLERVFDAAHLLHLIESRGVTTLMGIPTTYQLLADHPDFATTDLSSLGTIVVGGGPMPVPLLEIYHQRGVQLCQGYGLTEASPNVLCLPARYAVAKAGSAGKPYPHVDCALADPETHELRDGEATGELLVAGPGIFPGYFRDPEATEKVRHGRWLLTGDLVHRDADGFHFIVDRLKDMFISGGENVSPTEVEATLRLHPAVAQAAVIGVPDQRWGEVGKAFVVRCADIDEAALRTHCAERLAKFKVPKWIEFVDALPYNALNKIRRFSLRGGDPSNRAGAGGDG